MAEKKSIQGSICWAGNDPSRNLTWPGQQAIPVTNPDGSLSWPNEHDGWLRARLRAWLIK